jgi:hypothetical protein
LRAGSSIFPRQCGVAADDEATTMATLSAISERCLAEDTSWTFLICYAAHWLSGLRQIGTWLVPDQVLIPATHSLTNFSPLFDLHPGPFSALLSDGPLILTRISHEHCVDFHKLNGIPM